MPFPYTIECVNPELEIYTVAKTNGGNTYELRRTNDGGFDHSPTCKALDVYGIKFLCRHKKMVLGKYYAAEEYKYLFNLTPRRNKSIGKSQGA